MNSSGNLLSIEDAAYNLQISEELVLKFIESGIVKPIIESSTMKLTSYNLRRLSRAIQLYEQCFSFDKIELCLNN